MSSYELIVAMMNARFDKLEQKVDELQKNRWYVAGFSGGVVALFSLLGLFIQLIIGR